MDQSDRRIGFYQEAPMGTHGPIEAVWSYIPNKAEQLDAPEHILVAEPTANIIALLRRSPSGRIEDMSLRFHGPITRPQRFSCGPNAAQYAVRIHPDYIRTLFNITAKDAADVVCDLRLLAPTLAARLYRSHSPLTDEDDIVRALHRDVTTHFENMQTKQPGRPLVQNTFATVRRARGNVQVSQLASIFECSERHLRRMVLEQTGLPPKDYARLARFLCALEECDKQTRPDWADIANSVGYYDQAHMISDFQTFSGLSPKKLWLSRRAESDFSNRA